MTVKCSRISGLDTTWSYLFYSFCYIAGVHLFILFLEFLHFYLKVRVVHRFRSVLSLVALGIRFIVGSVGEQRSRLEDE